MRPGSLVRYLAQILDRVGQYFEGYHAFPLRAQPGSVKLFIWLPAIPAWRLYADYHYACMRCFIDGIEIADLVIEPVSEADLPSISSDPRVALSLVGFADSDVREFAQVYDVRRQANGHIDVLWSSISNVESLLALENFRGIVIADHDSQRPQDATAATAQPTGAPVSISASYASLRVYLCAPYVLRIGDWHAVIRYAFPDVPVHVPDATAAVARLEQFQCTRPERRFKGRVLCPEDVQYLRDLLDSLEGMAVGTINCVIAKYLSSQPMARYVFNVESGNNLVADASIGSAVIGRCGTQTGPPAERRKTEHGHAELFDPEEQDSQQERLDEASRNGLVSADAVGGGLTQLRMGSLRDYVVFVGNTGVGKSTLLNGLVGKLAIESGTKGGTGLTYKLQWANEGNVTYGDTPGLADAEKRKLAAQAISDAMRQNGRYKLVFVVTTEALRIRPQDATTMKLVLEALPQLMPYGIIIDKMSRPGLKKLRDEPDELRCMLTQINLDHEPTSFVFFNDLDLELHDLDNVVKPVSQKLRNFLDVLPSRDIRPEDVEDVMSDEFEALTEKHEKELNKVKEEISTQRELFDRQLSELENRHEEALAKARAKGSLLGKLAKVVGAVSVATASPIPFIVASSLDDDDDDE